MIIRETSLKVWTVCLFVIGIWVIMLGVSTSVSAQSNPLVIKVEFAVGEFNAKTLIDNLGKEYNLSFSYSDNVLENITISINKTSQISIELFLKEYLKPQGVGYDVFGQKIVLFAIEKPLQWFTISGYLTDLETSEDIIGATVYIADLQIGTVTNSYGYYSLKVPEGDCNIVFGSMGYSELTESVLLNDNEQLSVKLQSKTYEVDEISILSRINNKFLESVLINQIKIDRKSLQEFPGLFGENDALRNLSILPGIQTNELSTSNINVRGGGTDQTTFLMDGATLYNTSHFGGFFSIMNPDVVNNVNVYKSDVPVSEGGALSALIDVQLREGNNKKWQVKGGIGIISARGLIEGPIIKDKSSILIAYRRSYVDNVSKWFMADSDLKDINFYFYDANFKWNYKLNKNNRLFLSGYSGSDSFTQYTHMKRTNYLASARWNHLFGPRLFLNTTFNASKNNMTQGTQDDNELLYWLSEINNMKFKSDFSYYYSEAFKCSFGYAGTVYNIYPFSLLTKTEKTITTRYQSSRDQMLLNSLYYNQNIVIGKKLGIDAGVRATYMVTEPFSDSVIGINDLYWEPQFRISYIFNSYRTLKASFSQQLQPLHQLPVSTAGISINRWMPANEAFVPQISRNFTVGYYDDDFFGFHLSSEVYYRKMNDLIETMQDVRILNTDDPEQYLYHANGKAYGFEFLLSYKSKKVKGLISYDYSKTLWQNDALNLGVPYPASHTREHSINFSGVYYFNSRISASATWIFASGIPFTAANGKYQVNGKTYLQFDDSKVNTNKLAPYHRLDLSLDIAGKKNDDRRWKSFWNFSIYNAYFRKNPLGVFYFIPNYEVEENPVQTLNPGFFYLYQFVPSVSYRFEF